MDMQGKTNGLSENKSKHIKSPGMIKWSKWCLQPHTEDELRHELLTDFDNICPSYICRFSQFSENFVEELLALTTGLLNEKTYVDNIETLIELEKRKLGVADGDYFELIPKLNIASIKEKFMKEGEWLSVDEIKEKMGERADKAHIFDDRVDWTYIAMFQNLSPEFKQKYAKYLTEKELQYSDQVSLAHKPTKIISDKNKYYELNKDDSNLFKRIQSKIN